MSSSKKTPRAQELKSLTKKEQLWLPATPEKSSFQGSFYQPRTPQKIDISITDGILQTGVLQLDTVALKSLSSWPMSVLCRSLFLAPESMKLCGLGCGDLCRVTANDEERGVFWAWPQNFSDDKIEALASFEVMASLSISPSSIISIEKWTEESVQAEEIHLHCKCDRNKSYLSHPAFQALTALTLKNTIVFEKMSLAVNYYGRVIQLAAERVVSSLSKGDELSQVLNQLEGIKLDFSNIVCDGDSEDDKGLTTSTPCKTNVKKHSRDIKRNYFVVTESTRLYFERGEAGNGDDNGDEVKKAAEVLEGVGGLEDEIHLIREAAKGVIGPKAKRSFVGILLHGVSGSGKTLLGRSLPAILNHPQFIFASGPDFGSQYSGGSEAKLKELFERAKTQSQTVLFIDEIDVLCSVPDRGRGDQERKLCSLLRSLIDNLSTSKDSHIVLVGATSNPDAIDPSMRRPGRLDVEIEISVPNIANRHCILTKLLRKSNVNNLTEDSLLRVAQSAHGFVGADLDALVNATLNICGDEGLNFESFRRAFKLVKPSAMRQVQVEVPDVKWSDIGGMDELKLHLKQSVEWPLRHPEVYEKMGIKPPRGILMYGPPGCSKTMIAKALANESKLNFVSIKGPELFSKWVGESELAVRSLFSKARRVAPCIIFFDEIDALGSERGSGSGGRVGDRVLAQMLTEMDGVELLKDVTIVAATNRPDMIDKALMRPGRLDRVEYVPLPDFKTRLQVKNDSLVKMRKRPVFKIHTSKKPLNDDVQLEDLASQTEGYSGAEIAAVCNEAALKALEDLMAIVNTDEEVTAASNVASITLNHFKAALTMIKPRITQDLLQVYEKFQKINQR